MTPASKAPYIQPRIARRDTIPPKYSKKILPRAEQQPCQLNRWEHYFGDFGQVLTTQGHRLIAGTFELDDRIRTVSRRAIVDVLSLIVRSIFVAHAGISHFDTPSLINLTQNEIARYFPLIFK